MLSPPYDMHLKHMLIKEHQRTKFVFLVVLYV
jgi:hypothetical protein